MDEKIKNRLCIYRHMQMSNEAKIEKIHSYLMNAKKNGLPTDAYLQVGYTCNAKCVMCEIWKHPYLGDTKLLKKIIDKISDLHFDWITLWGGEPLIHPDIEEFITYSKEKGLKLQIINNGTLLSNHVHSICEYVDNLVVSIDSGIPEIHDTIRGKKNAWNAIVYGLKEILSQRKHPLAEIDCTILNENAETLASILELSRDLGGVFVDFDPAQINGVGNNHTYKLSAGIHGLENSQKLAEKYGIEITSREKIEIIKKYLNNEPIHTPCYSYCKDLLISPKGDVYTCWTISELIGNILDIGFVDTWHDSLKKNLKVLTGERPECLTCGFSHSRMPDDGYADIVMGANMARLNRIVSSPVLA